MWEWILIGLMILILFVILIYANENHGRRRRHHKLLQENYRIEPIKSRSKTESEKEMEKFYAPANSRTELTNLSNNYTRTFTPEAVLYQGQFKDYKDENVENGGVWKGLGVVGTNAKDLHDTRYEVPGFAHQPLVKQIKKDERNGIELTTREF